MVLVKATLSIGCESPSLQFLPPSNLFAWDNSVSFALLLLCREFCTRCTDGLNGGGAWESTILDVGIALAEPEAFKEEGLGEAGAGAVAIFCIPPAEAVPFFEVNATEGEGKDVSVSLRAVVPADLRAPRGTSSSSSSIASTHALRFALRKPGEGVASVEVGAAGAGLAAAGPVPPGPGPPFPTASIRVSQKRR